MADRKPLISGNWKMHHNHFEALQTVQKLSYLLGDEDAAAVDVSVHPPFTDLRTVQTAIETDHMSIILGAQNCHWEEKGAFTGEVSPAMLAKLNVAYVIAGHSERRRALRRDRRGREPQGQGDPAARDDADHVRGRDARGA